MEAKRIVQSRRAKVSAANVRVRAATKRFCARLSLDYSLKIENVEMKASDDRFVVPSMTSLPGHSSNIFETDGHTEPQLQVL